MIPKPVKLGPWPKGMDNVSPNHALAKDALRRAINLDVLDDGTLQLRSGLTLRIAGRAHSAWPPDGKGPAFYAVLDGVLTRYTRAVSGALTGTALRTGMGDLPVAYLDLAGDVYYSNGVVSGKLLAGSFPRPWGVERPSGQPALAALTSGGLFAGRYQVAVTFVDDLGEESGTGHTEAVDVTEGGGIALTKIPQPVDATVSRIRVYISKANGEVLYRYGDYAVGTTAVNLARSSTLGKELDTQFLIPPLPGTILESYNGRIYIRRSNVIYYTEPLRYGAMRLTNYMAFEEEVRIIKDGGVGLWVAIADKRTVLLQGSGPENFELMEKLPYGAAKGAVTELPGDKLFWMSSKGPVIAKGGEIEDLTDDAGDALVHVAIDVGSSGACAFMESRGVRQIIACVRGTGGRGLVAQDYIDLPGA
jgi:hypothetical protein